MTEQNEELLLTEEIRRLIRKECFVANGKCIPIGTNPRCQICNQDVRELLAKARPIIEKPLQDKIDILEHQREGMLITLRDAKKQERERIKKAINDYYANPDVEQGIIGFTQAVRYALKGEE